ncbi:MAG: lysozyme inhibitor LprI family protein [Bacteroidota bacterium]
MAASGKYRTHPIDASTSDCMKAVSALNRRTCCLSDAHQAWNELVNALVSEISANSTAAGINNLDASQHSWLIYRTAEFEWIDSLYSMVHDRNFLYRAAKCKMEITRSRALVLSRYRDKLLKYKSGQNELK